MAMMASNGVMVLKGEDVVNLYGGGQQKIPVCRKETFLPTRRMIRGEFLQSNEKFDNKFKNQK